METTINRNVTIAEIESVFENRNLINVRFYNCLEEICSENLDATYLYEIRIRHSPSENPRGLFSLALSTYNKRER